MDPIVRPAAFLRLENGREPFKEWVEGLEPGAMVAVETRLNRLRNGNFGDHRSIGNGIFELRVNKGPGYRIYYGFKFGLVVIIYGGTKDTQSRDIKVAQRLWREVR